MGEFGNPVIVIGGELTGLGVARALGRHGIDVFIVVNRKTEQFALFSKYCKRSYIASDMRSNQEVLKKLLSTIARSSSRRVVVYPTTDLDALNLSKLKDDLADDFSFVVGDKEPVQLLVNKSEFYKALNRNGIDYPVTYFPADVEDAQRIAAKIAYPAFIRPSITQIFTQNLGIPGKGFIANSSRELAHYYLLATKHGIEVMFQEIIPGPPDYSYQLEGYYNAEYSPLVLFARQRLRIWPPDFGNTTLCMSIPMVELAHEKMMVNRFIKKIGYRGLMSAEFKKDQRDGILKMLEINARPWWHFWLSAKCGADILFISYLDSIGEDVEYLENYATGFKSTYIVNDLKAVVKMLTERSLDFPRWVSSYRNIKNEAYMTRDDLAPFIMNLGAEATIRLRNLRKK